MAESHLRLLLELLDLIERYRDTVPRAALDHDLETWIKVKGSLETAATCAIDVALHLVSARGLGPPQSYCEAFALLARAGLLPAELARDLEDWAGLRNVLVHVYTALDLDRVHRALGQTEPLRAFHKAAAQALAAHREHGG